MSLEIPKIVTPVRREAPVSSFARRLVHLGIVSGLLCAWTAAAQPHDPSGIEFVTVGAVANQPWQGNGTPGDRAVGRGRVDYEYKIGRYEVTTAQWVEFMNAAFDRPADDRIPHVFVPGIWGAGGATPQTPGGLRWSVPAGNEMRAVGNITWRTAAIYCNWLHNGKSTDRSAFLSGAYDVSTFGYLPDRDIFTDQATRSSGARYFIPTWDEWLKAAHYDPNKNGPDQPGWWLYSYRSETQQSSGVPGVGSGNWGGTIIPNSFEVPLGAYTTVTSPWGLYDVAGATTEWTESIFSLPTGERYRVIDGSFWRDGPGLRDSITSSAAQFPSIGLFDTGFRIASAVPSTATLIPLCGWGAVMMFRSRRR